MSEIMSSQKMKRTCDACGAEKEWELVNVTETALNEMQEWYMITRKIIVQGPDGRPQFTAISANACSLPCVPAAAVKLALPPQTEEPADNIDLASLRASNFPN